jgi:sugar lactone lactonase YvrE
MMSVEIVEKLDHLPLCLLGESPRYSWVTNSLIFIDILSKKVYVCNLSNNETESMEFDQMVAFALPTSETEKDGLFLHVGLEKCIIEVDWSSKSVVRTVAKISPSIYQKGMRFNDANCSPSGELFAGYMHTQWRDGNKGYLYRLIIPASLQSDDEYILEDILSGADERPHLPNGQAWKDEFTHYLIDSGGNQILQLKYSDAENVPLTRRKIINRHVIFTLPEELKSAGGMMDGMTIDVEGLLWIAVTNSGIVIRVNPFEGTIVSTIALPCKKPTAVTFGK